MVNYPHSIDRVRQNPEKERGPMKKIASLCLCALFLLTLSSPPALAVETFAASEACVELIKEYEGFRDQAYEDNGKWYIGYGTNVELADYPYGITEEEADWLLRQALADKEESVNRMLMDYGIFVTQYQFDAMVSMTYNLGTQWMRPDYRFFSYLLQGIENYTEVEVVNAIATWCHQGTTVKDHLAQRRLREASLFLYGDYDGCLVSEYCYIHFEAGGGQLENTTIFYPVGQPYGQLPVPILTGRRFLGWYDSFGQQYTGVETAYGDNLTLTARWDGEAAPQKPEIDYSAWVNPYSDVTAESWFFAPVRELSYKGVMSGYPDGTFRPDQELTCGEALKLILLAAGAIMILTLWTSKKAMHVTETELSLSAQGDEGTEQYGSSVLSRTIVRAALNINAGIERVIPPRVRAAISRRFEYEDIEHSGAPYDMIRATVNLTTSAMLIAIATSLKLPLSTTYVCFMVAMGSSLADRAWGRESAVYRISGVMTVVAGWFITALGGFLIAFVVGLALIYGGTVAFVIVTLLCGYMLIHSNFLKKGKSASPTAANADTRTNEDIIASLREEVCRTMECATKIYDRTLIAVFKENRKVLRDMVKESNDLFYQSRERKYTLLPTLKKLQSGDVNTAHYYVQVVDYLNEMTKALMHITRPAFEHIDNNHEGLSKEQAKDLMSINDDVESIYRHINQMLRDGDFTEIEMVLALRDQLFESIAEAIKSELGRINEARSNTKASMLYLTILTETKNMVLQSRNLLKSQQYFLKHRAGAPQRWIKPTK